MPRHALAMTIIMTTLLATVGYDIEDATVLNQAALDRGYGRAFIFKRHKIVKKTCVCERVCVTLMDMDGRVEVGWLTACYVCGCASVCFCVCVYVCASVRVRVRLLLCGSVVG